MTSTSLSALVLLSLAGSVHAQTMSYADVELPDGAIARRPVMNMLQPGPGPADGYALRATTVLDNLAGGFSNATLQTIASSHLLDNFRFAPGPWATQSIRIANAWNWSFWIGHWDGPNSPAFNIRFRFYNASAFASTIGAGMIPAGSTLAGNLVYSYPAGYFNSSRPNVGSFLRVITPDVDLSVTPGAEALKFSDDSFLIEASIEDPSDPTKLAWYPSAGSTNPNGNAGLYIPAGENTSTPVQLVGFMMMNGPVNPGSALSGDYGRDMNGDGVFTASAPIAGGGFTTGADVRDTRTNAGRSLAIRINGDAPVCFCRVTPDLGCLADGATSITLDTRAPGGISAVKFCLPHDVTDAQRRFLDIIGRPGSDYSVGVYNADTGALAAVLASDDNSGDQSLGLPQLSFGVGRRPKPSPLAQPLDGRNGELPAGTYYAIVSGPAAVFADGYAITVPDPTLDEGGAQTLRFVTNVNAGALVPSDAPVPADYGGSFIEIPPLYHAPTGVQAPPYSVTWYQFDVCNDVSNPLNGEFLDIDAGRANPSGPMPQLLLFDGFGNLIATNVVPGAPVDPQLSFSSTLAPPRHPERLGASLLAGQNGTLNAGNYYLAVGLNSISTLVGGDRWHVRPQSPLSIPVPVDFLTNIACIPIEPCPCVADFDGSLGTPDATDIDAFFIAWLAGASDADADCSGGTPDATDIDQFFLEWLAGGC